MDISSKRNIKVGECLIDVQHDFQIEGFVKLFKHILDVDKQALSCKLMFKDIWTGYSDEILEAEGTSREEVKEIFSSIDKRLMGISSLQIHECRYVFNGSMLKIFIEYVCDSGFTDVVEVLSDCVNKVYRLYLYENRYSNNLNFKEERI